MAKLSYKEIKAILLIHNKADYSQRDKIRTLIGIVDGKKMLYSPVGLQYRSALQKIADGQEVSECCFCHGPITGGKGVICDECVEKLTEVVARATREHEEKLRIEREEEERLEAERLEKERLEREEEERRQREEAERLERKEAERLEAERLERERLEREEAERLEREEAERLEAERLEKERQERYERGEELEYIESGEEPKEAEETEETNEPEEDEDLTVSAYDPRAVRDRNGRMFFVICVIILLILGSVITGLMIHRYNKNKQAAEERAAVSTEIYPFVGGYYSDLSKILGKSQQLVDSNIRFFDKSCVTVIYDNNTGRVTYVDQNNVGALKTTLFGVCPGMTKDEVKMALSGFGLKKPVSDADNTLKYEYSKGLDNPLELGVSFVDGRVELVSVQVKQEKSK